MYLLVNVTRYKFVQGLHGYLCYETERILIFYLFIYLFIDILLQLTQNIIFGSCIIF